MLALSDSGQPPPNRFEPQTEQNVFAVPSSGWYVRSSSLPSRIVDLVAAQPPVRGSHAAGELLAGRAVAEGARLEVVGHLEPDSAALAATS